MRRTSSFLVIVALAGAAAVAWLGGCRGAPDIHRFSFTALGRDGGGTVYVWDRTIRRTPKDVVVATVDSVAALLSARRDTSELARLNAAPADTEIHVSEWLNDCLQASEALKETSGGAFDPSDGPLVALWEEGRADGREPDQAQIEAAHELLGRYRHDPIRRTVRKLDARVTFDLDGVVGGYAIDLAVKNLIGLGISGAMIDLDGDAFCLGLPEHRDAWTAGIHDPLDHGGTFATVPLVNRAVATCGPSGRLAGDAGRRDALVVDSATGRPASGLLSATVIDRSATLADGLSATLYALGFDAAVALMRDHYRRAEAVLVLPGAGPVRARVFATPGLRGKLELRPEYVGRCSLEFLEF